MEDISPAGDGDSLKHRFLGSLQESAKGLKHSLKGNILFITAQKNQIINTPSNDRHKLSCLGISLLIRFPSIQATIFIAELSSIR